MYYQFLKEQWKTMLLEWHKQKGEVRSEVSRARLCRAVGHDENIGFNFGEAGSMGEYKDVHACVVHSFIEKDIYWVSNVYKVLF